MGSVLLAGQLLIVLVSCVIAEVCNTGLVHLRRGLDDLQI
jgi:hypothetical protein